MHKPTSEIARPLWLLGVAAITGLALAGLSLMLDASCRPVSAHSGDSFGPACGAATIDGVVDPAEWSAAVSQTVVLQSLSAPTPLTATLFVMNGAGNLYVGFTIEDDEFSTVGMFLPRGDELLIYFDNDHSGSSFAVNDDVLSLGAGTPQFEDRYVVGNPAPTSNTVDTDGGGLSHGQGAASRVANRNHFELKHPLCSGEALDFCLQAGDTVGFRLEYLDAEGDGSFGGSFVFPDPLTNTVADIVVGPCAVFDVFLYLPLIQK